MADAKISALTAGTPALSTDEIPVARSGANRKLTVAEVGGFSGLYDRFPGVDLVYYGPARAGKPAPTGAEVVLTAAQFKAINSAPPTIIAAVAGKMIVPIRMHMRKEAGAGFVVGANTGIQWRLGSGTGQQVGVNALLSSLRFDLATEEANLWIHASTTVVFANTNVVSNPGPLTVQNVPLILFGATADLDAAGGSPVHISVLAELWPVVLV